MIKNLALASETFRIFAPDARISQEVYESMQLHGHRTAAIVRRLPVGPKIRDTVVVAALLTWRGAYLALTVRICEPVAYWCLDFDLAVGSLLASVILFFLPLALLAMNGPFLVRVVTSSVAGVGGNVGRLISIGTLGSLAGTLLISYVLIPRLPNSLTMYYTALTLMLVCGGYFLFCMQGGGNLGPAPGVGWALGGKSYLGLTHDYTYVIELFRGNSHFGMSRSWNGATAAFGST